jgi:predicted AAA+ superfamily ATPase
MIALAARTGGLLNMSSLAKDVGVDDKTIKRWLSILQDSGTIYLLQPFSLNVNKRSVKTPKVYFTDTGLVAFLCRWLTPDTLANGAMSGNIYETFIIAEILKSYYNDGKDPNMFFFRNTDGQEVDLLFYTDGTLYPVEIKKTASPNLKDIKNFKTLQTNFPSLIIGEGGIICNHDRLLPLADKNRIIPFSMI